jgi:hypothetical protein
LKEKGPRFETTTIKGSIQISTFRKIIPHAIRLCLQVF